MMYTPDNILIRNNVANIKNDVEGTKLYWNSTDSEYHFKKNEAIIDSRYTKNNVVYTYNSLGHRAPELKELTDDFILCMGCSYTEGIGVDDADTWPAMLASHSGMATYNLGIGGSSTMIQLINSNQWIMNKKKYPLPRCVVVQIPEVTRTPRAILNGRNAQQNEWPSSIELIGTTPSNNPGQIRDDEMYVKWKEHRNQFSAEATDNDLDWQHTLGDPDISPWFLTSQLMVSLQLMWNAVGVPVLQMTYDDDGDIIYNPFNVFRITGDICKDFARDRRHMGIDTHTNLVEAIWPQIQELLEWTPGTRQKRDIVRLPYNAFHYTLTQAMAERERLTPNDKSPFVYP